MGKSTISTGPFSIAMLVHQRVSMEISWEYWWQKVENGVIYNEWNIIGV